MSETTPLIIQASILAERSLQAEEILNAFVNAENLDRWGEIPALRRSKPGREAMRKLIRAKHQHFGSACADLRGGNVDAVNRGLGYWLCAYWMGTPDLNAWNQVVSSQSHPSLPGGAIYEKLCGDVYRYELRQRQKRGSDISDKRSVMVVAFSPSVVISMEQKKRILVAGHSKLDPRGVDHSWLEQDFKSQVDLLASLYLRLQLRRYLRGPGRGPLSYLVGQDALRRTIAQAAVAKCTCEHSDPGSLTNEQIVAKVAEVQEDARTWARRFTKGSDVRQVVIPIDNRTASDNGLSSCVLGEDVGVVSQYPNSMVHPSPWCRWLQGEELRGERAKVNQAATKASVRLTFEEWIGSDWFAPEGDAARVQAFKEAMAAFRAVERDPASTASARRTVTLVGSIDALKPGRLAAEAAVGRPRKKFVLQVLQFLHGRRAADRAKETLPEPETGGATE